MKIRDIQEILKAQLLCGDDCLDHEIRGCFACDLISEMLLHIKPCSLLVTSLLNAHVVHTANVMDVCGVVFVGGKKPDEAIIANAKQKGIPLLSTPLLIYECCGRLFTSGVHMEDINPIRLA
jgi:predicted transcriptional regulator